jgi:L-fuculose-phosphate aldolase
MNEHQLRTNLLTTSRSLVELGLNRGASGNASVRDGGGLLITPSAMLVSEMTPDSMVRMDLAGNILQGGKPSSEWRFHRDIFVARAGINAVIHVHSTFATTIACLRRDVPAVHYMIALGKDLDDALAVAVEVEFLCEIYWRTLQIGEPHILTSQQMHDVKQKFVEYKQRS